MSKLIIANWKMNPERALQAAKLAQAIARSARAVKKTQVVICPPFVFLEPVSKALHPKPYTLNPALGAQDCAWSNSGPHTGSVSPTMLKDAGARYVILGHSERRRDYGETDHMVGMKAAAAINAGLIPVICIGEWTRKGKSMPQIRGVVRAQLAAVFRGLGKGFKNKKIVIAYEPVWAISTVGGGEETSADSAIMIRFIRSLLNSKFLILNSSVIYGGSVNAKNAEEFLSHSDIEGALVGAASLRVNEFLKIIKAAERAHPSAL